MRKFGRATIQRIIDRAIKEFIDDEYASQFVIFPWDWHRVEAKFEWSISRGVWYLAYFNVVYTHCVMQYCVSQDYDITSALCR